MHTSQVGLVVMPIGAIDFIADSGQGHFHFDLIWNFLKWFVILFLYFSFKTERVCPKITINTIQYSLPSTFCFDLDVRSRCSVPKFTSPKTMYFEFQCSNFQKIEKRFKILTLTLSGWKFGLTVCQFYLTVDYTASTASIFNLFILSLDR